MNSNNTNGGNSDVEPVSSTGNRKKAVIDTRRAEQNRAAQRAFRQRKERYVKELESKVREMQGLQEKVEKLEQENERLRQRIWELEHPSSSSSSSTNGDNGRVWSEVTTSSEQQQQPTVHHHQRTGQQLHRHNPYPPPPLRLHHASSVPRPSSAIRLSDQWPNSVTPVSDSPQNSKDDESGSEKGRVLDDLISLLRSRNRPPIPTHLDGTSSSSSTHVKIETSIR